MAKVVALTERTIAQRFAGVKDEETIWGDQRRDEDAGQEDHRG